MKRLELAVLNGEQAGACSVLTQETAISIGSSLDDDIILRDSLIQDRKIKLRVEGDLSSIEVLIGEIELAGNKVTEGQRVTVPMYTAVRMGGTTFALGEQGDPRWSKVSQTGKKAASEDSHMPQSENGAQDHHSKPLVANNRATLYVTASFLLLAGVVFFATTIFRHSEANTQVMSFEDRAKKLADKIHALGFSDLQVRPGDSNHLVVSGSLGTTEQYMQLEDVLARSPEGAELDVQVAEQLTAQVQNVYRVNGVNAEVKSQSPGSVTVYSAEKDAEKLEHLKEIALRDIRKLENISVENKPPKNSGKPNNGAVIDNPGKQVTLVVPGDSGYVVTQDKSRYFVGSMLPTGHLITGFEGKQVLVEKKGVNMALEF
jgi:type III secretion protein D